MAATVKEVRRAAGTVRDLDVHRELLADNFLPAGDKAARELAQADELRERRPTPARRICNEMAEQARALDAWLKARRAHGRRCALRDAR